MRKSLERYDTDKETETVKGASEGETKDIEIVDLNNRMEESPSDVEEGGE